MDASLTPAVTGNIEHAGTCAILEVLRARRSVAPKRLIAPGPSPEALAAIIAAGLTAPDHCLLRPWYYVRIPDAKRAELGRLFAEEKRQHQPGASQDDVEKERARAFNAPTLVAVLLEIATDHAKVPVHEQYCRWAPRCRTSCWRRMPWAMAPC
jgi:nitroreductase